MVKKIMFLSILIAVASCGPKKEDPVLDLSKIEDADLAVERARQANAPIFAPREYDTAFGLQQRMHDEVRIKEYAVALSTADQVLIAANAAIHASRQSGNIGK